MSLQINKAVYSILSSSADLKKKIEDKLFPIISNEETTYPFIVYKRESISDDEDFKNSTNCTVGIFVATNNYTDGIEIAEIVKEAMISESGLIAGIIIDSIKLDSADEDYEQGTFIQYMKYEITTSNYNKSINTK